MAYTHFIPKIEWLKATITGTLTISSTTVSGVSGADILLLSPGMYIEGAGIATDTTIVSVGATDFVISNDATAAGPASLDVGFRLEFELPPKKDPLGENLVFKGTQAVAKSGVTQTIEDYLERTNKINFSHISETLKGEFDNFLLTHCLKGLSFSYFEDKGEPTSELIVERLANYTSPGYKIITTKSKALGKNFLWEFSLSFRRVL